MLFSHHTAPLWAAAALHTQLTSCSWGSQKQAELGGDQPFCCSLSHLFFKPSSFTWFFLAVEFMCRYFIFGRQFIHSLSVCLSVVFYVLCWMFYLLIKLCDCLNFSCIIKLFFFFLGNSQIKLSTLGYTVAQMFQWWHIFPFCSSFLFFSFFLFLSDALRSSSAWNLCPPICSNWTSLHKFVATERLQSICFQFFISCFMLCCVF